MRKIWILGLPLLLIGIATQAVAQDPKWKDTKEYDDYIAVYNATDLAVKAQNAEKFFVDHKDADPIALTQVYQMMILSYANGGNWAKTLETVERAGQLAPKLEEADKQKYTEIGLLAAVNLKNNAKTVEYAEKVLAFSPNNLNALFSLSNVLSQTLPTQEPAKGAQIARTLEITRKALSQPKPAGTADAQWNGIMFPLHQTACLMLLNQQKYPESIEECEAALKVNGKDSYPWYLIGLSHKAGLVERVKQYNEALDKYNASRTTANQIELEDLRAVYEGLEKVASDKRDETLDAFARAVVLGGPAAAEARKELEGLFTGTPAELQQLIDSKKGD